MDLGRKLKIFCPPDAVGPVGTEPSGLLGAVSRWSPFVFPWSALQRMTGVVISDGGVTMARGRLDGRFFHVEWSAQLPDGDPVPRYGQEPVCVCLPRSSTLVRHFRVPAEKPTEIEAMLPHLLTGELPMSVEHFSWVWTPLPAREEGFTLVAVHVARNDRLEEFLAPLAEAGLNIVGLIPEGWSWAHAMSRVRGPDDGDDATSVLIRNHGGPHLIVERSGRLLFDTVLPPSVVLPLLGAADSALYLDWEGPGLAEARDEFESLLGFPLPTPQIWPDVLPCSENTGPAKFFFAASVATAGLDHERLMMPPELRQRTRRRSALKAAAGLGRLVALAALVWLVFAVYADGHTRRYLAELDRQIVAEASRVEVLEMEYDAIRENNRARAGSTEILQILTSRRLHVTAPVHLANLNYIQGRGVTLRGGAPASSHVLEMTEKLAADPLWEGLRVMQLRSEKLNGVDHVHFVVEGRLN